MQGAQLRKCLVLCLGGFGQELFPSIVDFDGFTIKLESMAPRFEFSGAFFYDVPRTIGEGYYKVNSLVFAGDSHGDQWESQISCLRLSAAAQAGISERATR